MKWQFLVLAVVTVSACGPTAAGLPGEVDAAPCSGATCPKPDAPVVAAHVDASTLLDVKAIQIVPADPVIMSVDGSHPTQSFTVLASLNNGQTITASGDWTIAVNDMGTFDLNAATFTANGASGGVTKVEVDVTTTNGAQIHGMTTLTVKMQRTQIGTGVPVDAPSHFLGTPVVDATRAALIDYPLDGAVMPQNVYPADIQWENGVAGDIFRVTMHKPDYDGVAYVMHTGAAFAFDWPADTAMWRSFTQTDDDVAGGVTVDRWDHATNQVVSGKPVTVRFAKAALTGSVYYWDIAAGRAVRIDDGSGVGVQFMPTPPVALDGTTCVGCHVVSNDGRWFIGRLGGGDNIGTVFDLTLDLSTNPPPSNWAPTVSPPSLKWWFASFNPDATRMLAEENLALELVDPAKGVVVPLAAGSTPLPATFSTHPAWSPDGTRIAYVSDTNDWGGNFSAGNISMLPVLGPDRIGPTKLIHMATTLTSPNPAVGNADSYPTWSPDSKLIAFAHGSGCRSETQQAALYLMNPDGSGVVRLDKASGGPTASNDYHPNFSPFMAGGYYWMTFLSRRDYGNTAAGTKGTTRQQVWVSAVAMNPTPGTDPSEVGYWLPGQKTTSQNISAFWAPRACRQNGAACGVSAECCSDLCEPDGMGHMTCAPPPPSMCREQGQSCGGASDCCVGLVCTANVCDHQIN